MVCTRGSCQPDERKLFDSVISIERTKHSVKPNEFYDIIEALYVTGRRLELFARTARAGWTAWGNEAPLGGEHEADDDNPDDAVDEIAIPDFLRRRVS